MARKRISRRAGIKIRKQRGWFRRCRLCRRRIPLLGASKCDNCRGVD